MTSRAATAAIQSLHVSIRMLGVSGQLVRASDPDASPLPLRFLRTHPQRRDEQIVNAFGINALILTLPPIAELLAKPPAKYDLVLVGTPEQPTYALDTVLARMLDDTVIAFTAYVRGRTV
ncbi:hypothetical protein [Variovorax sp. HW608]|uniref:hypothetical protein n=1 Tax=Variovorax sp. HW608 TaxID=1034889 RepID=UPI000B5B0BC7|nr:hypothetical protein [Variovorax sp. HW608]